MAITTVGGRKNRKKRARVQELPSPIHQMDGGHTKLNQTNTNQTQTNQNNQESTTYNLRTKKYNLQSESETEPTDGE